MQRNHWLPSVERSGNYTLVSKGYNRTTDVLINAYAHQRKSSMSVQPTRHQGTWIKWRYTTISDQEYVSLSMARAAFIENASAGVLIIHLHCIPLSLKLVASFQHHRLILLHVKSANRQHEQPAYDSAESFLAPIGPKCSLLKFIMQMSQYIAVHGKQNGNKPKYEASPVVYSLQGN